MRKVAFFVIWALAGLLIFAGAAAAAQYPKKTVTIVVPYSPGGGSDVMVRWISKIIKQYDLVPKPVVVVNKTGGGGLVGKTFVFKKPADGYHITLADLGNVIYPIVNPSTKWKTTDWAYIANLVFDFNLLCVKAGTYRSLSQLIEAAKKATKPLSAGGTGAAGGPDSMCTLKLNKSAGIKLSYVPMKGGGEVVSSLLGGHINMGWFNPSEIMGQIEAGKVIPLAVTSDKRLEALPDVPTFKELGYDVYYVQQRGLAMKGGTPQYIVDYWIGVLKKVIQTKEWKEGYLKRYNLEDGWLPGKEFEKWMLDAVDDFKKSIKYLKELGA